MLEDVTISNFALIDSVSLEFNSGFTVLSGETGAGKSILIGALSFLLGGKGGTEVIRQGASEAKVSGTFSICKNQLESLQWLEEHGIQPEDGRVLIRRFVRENGKTGAWIQEVPVTRTELAEFASFLVDIHGQHQHQSLLRVLEHRRFLDSYAGITEEVASFTSLYAQLVEKRKQLDELCTSDADRQRRIELLTFAVNEIEEAKLKPEEEDNLTAEENRLLKFEQIYSDVEAVTSILSGIQEGFSVLSALKKAQNHLSQAANSDATLSSLDNRLESSFYEISDIAEELRSFTQGLVFDPDRLEYVQERLALIFKLKKKYASQGHQSSLAEVIEYAKNARRELENITSSQQNKDLLELQVEQLSKTVYTTAKKLSEKRKLFGKQMSKQIESVLSVLGMKGAVFSVSVEEKPETEGGVMQKCGPYGMDDVEFLISTNQGSPVKPLAKIASGGELSRVMLAIKTILAESDSVDTLVFDEIDTGIGGEVSVAVGAHLKKLSKKSQIFCITHVASIACYADNQIKIAKNSGSGSTVTSVQDVSGRQRVEEIARMLSGDAITTESLEHAESLLSRFGGISHG
ncbi:MAG: DNA repair protein RecN [Spirochaetaceae bacterium]|nr:DNA repair protein RecN [Spirochaetaceae bacterium]